MSRLRALVVAVLALLVTLCGLAAAPARAADPATVTGTVTSNGAPLSKVCVELNPPGDGQSLSATTDVSGHYRLSVPGADGSALPIVFRACSSGAQVAPAAFTVEVGVGATVIQNADLSQQDAEVVATVTGIPAGTDPTNLVMWAQPSDAALPVEGGQVQGSAIVVGGLAAEPYALSIAYGSSQNLYYPGVGSIKQASFIPLASGCTMSVAVNLTAQTMKLTGRDCSRLPACQSANAAAATANGVLAAKAKALTKAKKKYKRAKKHHVRSHTLKKLKKKLKKATAAKKRYAATQAAAGATAQRTCH